MPENKGSQWDPSIYCEPEISRLKGSRVLHPQVRAQAMLPETDAADSEESYKLSANLLRQRGLRLQNLEDLMSSFEGLPDSDDVMRHCRD